MAKSDARFGYRADLGREVHDLSAPFGFTTVPGMLNPIFEDIATPGDTYYINHDLTFMRTQPLLGPAMIDVKVHVESFFVPFPLIYQPIETALFGITTNFSSLFGDKPQSLANNDLPKMVFSDIRDNCLDDWKHSSRRHDIVRMMDLFGMNADSYIGDSTHSSRFVWNPSVFPWQWLAYHCIYQYYYRLDDKSEFDNSFNFDQFRTQSTINMGLIYPNFFMMHQRPWDFDYFTSMYRSPIVSDASLQEVLPKLNYSPLSHSDIVGIDVSRSEVSSNSEISSFAAHVDATYQLTQQLGKSSTAIIRQMFANEKLAMITGRARKSYDSQVLAHFGVEVPHDVKHDISFIGGDSYDLRIGEVTSLSASSSSGLGDLAGKGWSSGNGKQHKFKAPCHGVVMTLFSVEPKKRYYGGFDRINAMTNAFDIPVPEFDKLGNIPMFRYEAGENAGSGTVSATDIIGWKERYYYNKRRHAKVTLAFQNPTIKQTGYNEWSSYMIASTPFGAYTSTNNNTARPDLESRFYIDRNCMDGLMVAPYIDAWQNGLKGEETSENWNASPWLSYQRDPFIVDMDLKVKKVSWMSKDGEPIYNF